MAWIAVQMPLFPNYYDDFPDEEVGEVPHKEVAAGQGRRARRLGSGGGG